MPLPIDKLPFALALLLLTFLAFFELPAAAQGPKYRVEIAAPEGLAAMLRANLDIVRWSTREDVTEDQLRQLARTAPEQARNLLATEGYFSATVTAALSRQEQGWVTHMKVEPGDATRIVSVDLRVRGAIESDPERSRRIEVARADLGLEKNAVFRQADWDAAKQRALRSVQRSRYAAARLSDSRADIDPVAREARLLIEIDSGPPFVFGELEVTGLNRYPLSTVQNLSPIRAGDPYDEERMATFQRRLLSAGQFASAVVTAGNDPAQAGVTPVRVSLVESAARTIELGAGFSTDRGPRFQAGYNDRNALDRAWRFNSELKVDRLSEQVVGGLTFPRKDDGWRYGVEGKYNNQDIQGESRTDWSVTGAHTYTVEERESQFALQLLEEKRRLVDGPADNRKALFASQSWMWNGLDDLLSPSSGQLLRLQVGGASQSLGSDRSFGRVQGKGVYIRPVGNFGSLLLRLEAGAVISDTRENIPSAYLFRTGGDTSVRGYAFESIGVEEGGAIVGGRYMAAGSIEYIQWLTREWGAAVFYDVGDAVDEPGDFRAVAGYGVGARWRSPLGMLSLDVAYGEEVKDVRLHLNVGFVFR